MRSVSSPYDAVRLALWRLYKSAPKRKGLLEETGLKLKKK